MGGVEILLQCGECSAPVAIASSQTVGLAPCVCGSGADVGYSFAHAPWCVVCGDDLTDCECAPVDACGECGAVVPGVVCESCGLVVEPAGYWAWDAEMVSDYAVTLERAAARYQVTRPDLSAALIAYWRAWCARNDLSDVEA